MPPSVICPGRIARSTSWTPPGSADFVGEAISAFRVADCVALVVGAEVGVQIETIKLWRWLTKHEKSRFIFVNKMEKDRADFDKCVADLTDRFKTSFVPVVIPLGRRARIHGRRGPY